MNIYREYVRAFYHVYWLAKPQRIKSVHCTSSPANVKSDEKHTAMHSLIWILYLIRRRSSKISMYVVCFCSIQRQSCYLNFHITTNIHALHICIVIHIWRMVKCITWLGNGSVGTDGARDRLLHSSCVQYFLHNTNIYINLISHNNHAFVYFINIFISSAFSFFMIALKLVCICLFLLLSTLSTHIRVACVCRAHNSHRWCLEIDICINRGTQRTLFIIELKICAKLERPL